MHRKECEAHIVTKALPWASQDKVAFRLLDLYRRLYSPSPRQASFSLSPCPPSLTHARARFFIALTHKISSFLSLSLSLVLSLRPPSSLSPLDSFYFQLPVACVGALWTSLPHPLPYPFRTTQAAQAIRREEKRSGGEGWGGGRGEEGREEGCE